MLEYENELLLDSMEDSGLFILAKGIAFHKVIQKTFQIYGTDYNLVFVLSANPAEESYFLNHNDKTRIFRITTEFTSSERKSMYTSGGIFFITPRIMVVDFLKDVVPAEKITGIIIFRAHNVLEASQEAFILRLYRIKNKTGFIKCFSHSPTSFLLGFSRVTAVMRSCFLPKLSLWPRFHATIKESLKIPEGPTSEEAVIEIQLKLTDEMREIQSNLMDLVSSTVSELKRLVPALNDEEVSVETALTKGFEKIIRAHVDPVWNTIDRKSKEILSDLKIFRLLLALLTKADCVTFYSVLFNYMSVSAEAALKSDWVMSKSAEKILSAAKQRLKPPKKKTDEKNLQKTTKSASPSTGNETFQPEIHPKWLAVGEILEEINKKYETEVEEAEAGSSLPKPKTIIFTQDSKTCSVIKNYLSKGGILTLAKIVKNCENVKLDIPVQILDELYCHSLRNHETDVASFSGESRSSSNKSDEGVQVDSSFDDIDNEADPSKSPVLVLPLKIFGEGEAYRIPNLLENFMPDNIIIFDPDLELIRNIEIHRARVGGNQIIRIYFLVFRNSIEEQIYLTGIAREKMAFEKLIEEKTTMVIPKEREGKDELNQDLWRDPTKASQSVTASGLSRRNMENVEQGQEIVLVDMREFRSDLPSLIHKRGIDLEPLTLDVGDYILTPDTCVERKSISDLIGSLNSGRLYKQAEAMGRHYKKPVLLIEQEQKFGSGRYKNDLTQVMPKLQLLTINFPKLRIIWSPGAHYTSEIFHELKRGKPQPEATQALAIMKDEAGSHSTSKFNPIPHALISKLPGIDSKNIYTILNRVNSLHDLCALSLEDLSSTLENSVAAGILYNGIHNKLVETSRRTIEAKSDIRKYLNKKNTK